MELEFVMKAIRRYWPVVVGCTLVSIIAAMLVTPAAVIRYQSTALVLITSGVEGSAGDRYVSSELVILQSPPIAQRAGELADLPLSPTAMAQSVSFVQIPGTDVVRIIASSASPTDAQEIANGYLDAYLEGTDSIGSGNETVDPAALDRRIAEIEEQLTDVEGRIKAVLAPYVEAAEGAPDGKVVSIPVAGEVAPALAVEREVLIDQYRTALQQRTDLELEPDQPATDGQTIQRAELPNQSPAASTRTLQVAVSIGGLLIGIALATALARSSRFVLDEAEVKDILGSPIAAGVRRERSLRSGSLNKLANLPDGLRRPINHLCIQVEAESAAAPGWTVVVTGTRRHTGTTTLAAAMALRFSELGSRVLLIDLDTEHPAISEHFGVDSGGLAMLIDEDRHRDRDVGYAPTGFPNLSVIGRQRSAGRWRPSRPEFQAVLQAASRMADVVVVDAGPMLSSSSAAVLAQNADAVVVAVPVQRQDRTKLELVARQLAVGGRHVFPVSMPVLKSRGKSGPATSASLPQADLDQVEALGSDDEPNLSARETASKL